MRALLLAALIAVLPPAVTVAAQPPASDAVASLVAIPVPAGLTRAQLVILFEASQPQYRQVPGLVRKYYSIGDDGRADGIYLWRDRAAAEAFYTDQWKADAARRWGAPATVRYFDVPIVLEGANAGGR
jgi:hypothetical protein